MKRTFVPLPFPAACLAACLAAAPASRPTTQPATTQEAKVIERMDILKRVGEAPAIGPYDISQVIHVAIENRRIVISSPLESFDGERQIRFDHPDDYATIDFHPMTPGNAPDQPRFIQLYRYDFRDPNTVFFHTSVMSHPGYAQIAGAWQYLEGMRDVSLIDQEEKLDPDSGGKADALITLRVHALDDDGNETHKVELTGTDLRALLRDHPAEVNEYLRPVLREMGAEALLDVDPQIAWQVFAPDAHPDPKLLATIRQLLPKLDAPAFADREAAAESLKKLGPSAAVALLQLDRTKLSPEQNSRLEEILQSYQQLDRREVQRLATDPAFLLASMDSQDPELRRVALARLVRKVGPVAFDPAAPPEQRHAQVESLRRKLLPRAATRAIDRPKSP